MSPRDQKSECNHFRDELFNAILKYSFQCMIQGTVTPSPAPVVPFEHSVLTRDHIILSAREIGIDLGKTDYEKYWEQNPCSLITPLVVNEEDEWGILGKSVV